MAGEQNGTKVFVAIEDSPGAATFSAVGGQTSHTLTLNNNPIDITNKSSASFRELLAGEGLQSLDLSLELQYNSDTAYQQLRGMAANKSQALFQIDVNGTIISGTFQVASFGETSPDNDKLSNTVSLLSSGSFTFL